MSHQTTELGQDRDRSPSLLEAIGMMSPYKLWWQKQMDWGRGKTSSCPTGVRCQPHSGHAPP